MKLNKDIDKMFSNLGKFTFTNNLNKFKNIQNINKKSVSTVKMNEMKHVYNKALAGMSSEPNVEIEQKEIVQKPVMEGFGDNIETIKKVEEQMEKSVENEKIIDKSDKSNLPDINKM